MSASEPLTAIFARLITMQGPISLQHYMGEANARYYASRDPLGADGDFVTAPEISQMFGEMVGIWLADIWSRAGRPEQVAYVELGPGRGTLARDALAVMRRFGCQPQVHLVESSPALAELQRQLLPGAMFHADLASVPGDMPMLLVANEFLDALPVRQLVKTDSGWRERMVGLADGSFVPVAGNRPMDAAVPQGQREAPVGTIIETCPGAAAVIDEVARRLASQHGAALVIDYGYAGNPPGSTLQALRAHRKVAPFATPGEADLTALVDFATMAEVAQAAGGRVLGIAEQGRWLAALGIETRAAALAKGAPDRTDELATALARLTRPEEMGSLFKVLGLVAPDWPDGAGF